MQVRRPAWGHSRSGTRAGPPRESAARGPSQGPRRLAGGIGRRDSWRRDVQGWRIGWYLLVAADLFRQLLLRGRPEAAIRTDGSAPLTPEHMPIRRRRQRGRTPNLYA